MARKKLSELKQTDGKLTNPEQKSYEPSTLDQIWGDNGTWKYGTMDSSEYNTQINDMNESDLRAHAVSVGLRPVDNRKILETRLLREFGKHVAGYRYPKVEKGKDIIINKTIHDILSEGK